MESVNAVAFVVSWAWALFLGISRLTKMAIDHSARYKIRKALGLTRSVDKELIPLPGDRHPTFYSEWMPKLFKELEARSCYCQELNDHVTDAIVRKFQADIIATKERKLAIAISNFNDLRDAMKRYRIQAPNHYRAYWKSGPKLREVGSSS